MYKIYLITNNLNGDQYVGQTKKSINHRFDQHKFNSTKYARTHLHKAINKYGHENFICEEIETTDSPDEREIFWIEKLTPRYNMTKGGTGGDTSKWIDYTEHSKRMTGNGNPRYGIKLTTEFKQKLSESHNPDLHRQKTLMTIQNGTHNSKIIIECEHCHKSISQPNYKRWHGDRCKLVN